MAGGPHRIAGVGGIYALLVVALTILSPYFLYFLTIGNLNNVLLNVSIIGLISVGMTMVIVAGGIDKL